MIYLYGYIPTTAVRSAAFRCIRFRGGVIVLILCSIIIVVVVVTAVAYIHNGPAGVVSLILLYYVIHTSTLQPQLNLFAIVLLRQREHDNASGKNSILSVYIHIMMHRTRSPFHVDIPS